MGESVNKRDAHVELEEGRGLEELEGVIALAGTFVEVGRSLLEIQSRRLDLQAGCRSLATYVSERWDLSETHAYLKIKAVRVSFERPAARLPAARTAA